LNIYGYFDIGTQRMHYITFACITVLGLVYLYRLMGTNVPFLSKILLPGAYVAGALMHYEILWNSVWMFYWRIAALDFIGFALCEALIIYTIGELREKYYYNIPRIDMRRWLITTVIVGLMILWLYSTGFYVNYKLLYIGTTDIDPHNLSWAVGKITCLLSWLWIPCCERF